MTTFADQCLAVEHAGQHFLLHPDRVMYWPAQKILFAADVHMGKEHVFGRHGIAIPGGLSESSLSRLFELARASDARRLIVLGDFLHNIPRRSENWLQQLSEQMNQSASLSVEVVAGNHDKRRGRLLTDERLVWHSQSIVIDNLVLHHEPCEDSRGFVLCGHIHPVWRLGSARRGASVRAPVFWFREHYAVLPAFGEFTGGMMIEPDANADSLYMTGPESVLAIPPAYLKKDQRSRHGRARF